MDGREPKEDVRGGAEKQPAAEEKEVEARLGWTRKFKT